jgi:hypothetical protein
MPLEKQIVNTLRENFLWSENTDTLFVVNGGLYRIDFGLFSHSDHPQGSLIINGVCHFTTSNRIMNMKDSKNKMNQNGQPLVKKISHTGYYLLANESKVSVLCLSENLHEGFIDIKRM